MDKASKQSVGVSGCGAHRSAGLAAAVAERAGLAAAAPTAAALHVGSSTAMMGHIAISSCRQFRISAMMIDTPSATGGREYQYLGKGRTECMPHRTQPKKITKLLRTRTQIFGHA